jgi:ankyrin repeat protein
MIIDMYINISAQEGHLDCLEWLTKRSATVHSQVSIDGMTAAHASAQEGHLDCLAFLIQCAGCSGLARDKSGCTPMHFGGSFLYHSDVYLLLVRFIVLYYDSQGTPSSFSFSPDPFPLLRHLLLYKPLRR